MGGIHRPHAQVRDMSAEYRDGVIFAPLAPTADGPGRLVGFALWLIDTIDEWGVGTFTVLETVVARGARSERREI